MELAKVGVLLRDEEQDYPLQEITQLFGRHGIELVELEWEEDPPIDLDLVMAMGGDGTALKALDLCPRCPVLAINYGTVGFLTAGDRVDLESILARLLKGEFLVSERITLECEYPSGRVRAVNEVMVRTYNRLMFIDVSVDDIEIRTIRGDGVVVGAPTGSTGFLLSAGAPIVMPDVRCLVLDGINEYNFSSRAIILAPEARIRLHINPQTKDNKVYLTVDGRPHGDLCPGDDILIRKADTPARLIYFDRSYFFHNLSSRLNW
jgi:NAD+ kinase